jgi:hypothetical protein
MTRGMLPFIKRPMIEASPMLKAMGTLMAIKPIKARLRMRPIY